MKILLTIAKTDILGGSLVWAYTVCSELVKRHDVYIQTHRKGRNHHRFLSLGVKDYLPIKYDKIIGNHLSLFPVLNSDDITNVCHGAIVGLEKPDNRATSYISVSKEVQDSLKKAGYNSRLLMNPVDLNRYQPNGLGTGLLSLCQGQEANNLIQEVCNDLKIKVTFHNKYKNPVWNLWEVIPNYRSVVSLGRGVYESLACNKPVIVMDSRDYTPSYGDGLLTRYNYEKSKHHNCSGRAFKLPLTKENVTKWISNAMKAKGNYRKWAEEFNSKKIVNELL